MPQLPTVGGDDGVWGTYLNDFLAVSLDSDNVTVGERGKLRPTAVDAAGAVMNTDTSTSAMSFVVDEDNMASDSATKVPTQQSVKAYADTKETKAKVTPIAVSTATAAGTAAKVATTVGGTYTPVLGDIIFVTFTNANTATSPTINIDGSGAKSILLGNANPTGVAMAGTKVMMWYDGTAFQLFGSQRVTDTDTNTTYIEATAFNTVSTTTQAAAVNTGYIANNASQVNFTLPGTVAIGQIVHVLGLGAGGWRVTAPAGDNIMIEGNSTGAAGYIFGGQYASVTLRCIVANATWEVVGYTGNITTGVGYSTATLTGKSISLSSNTLTGTTAEFNTALTDNDFTTIAGTETLTNKTLTSPVLNTGVSGTAIDTDGTLTANSDSKLASQKATKTYTDNLLATPRKTGGIGYRTKGLDSWFTKFDAATPSAPVDVIMITDSIWDIGSLLTDPSPVSLLARQLNALKGMTGADAPGGSSLPAIVHAQPGSGPSATSSQGTINSSSTAMQGSTLTNTQVLTHTATCTSFTVVYQTDPSYGTLTIKDGPGGATLGTINCSATAKSGNMWTSGAISDASHTLHITSTGTTCVELISPNKGQSVRVWPVGLAGATSNQFYSSSSTALDFIDTLEAAGTLGLVIIATGVNDDSNYSTRVPALISAVQGHTSANVALWLSYINNAFPTSEYGPARVAAFATGLPVIDASMVADQAVTADLTHPATQTRVLMATQVASVIGGDPIGSALRYAGNPYIGRGTNNTRLDSGGLTFNADTSIFRGQAAGNIAIGTPLSLFLGSPDGVVVSGLQRALNSQTGTAYSVLLSDNSKVITRNNASASTQTWPKDSTAAISIGAIIETTNSGVGTITHVAESGATITGSVTQPPKTTSQAIKTAANTWFISVSSAFSESRNMTGMYGGSYGMNKWRMSTRDLKHIVCWGDSVTQGLGIESKTRSMTDGLRQILSNEFNEQLQEGFQPIFWLTSATPSRYSQSGGWTAITGPSASNLSPAGVNGAQYRSTNNTLRTLTWTRPAGVRCTKFYIYWVDDSTTTSGAKWSYSVDGGTVWTEVATTSPGSPTFNATEVTGVDDPTTIMIRNANSAGTTYTNSPCFMGIDIRHSDYGWVVHNFGYSGGSLSLLTASNSCGAVSTDRAGSWSPLFDYLQPELTLIEFSNDTVGYDASRFNTALTTACSTLSVYSDLIAYGFPDQSRLTGGADIANVRNATIAKVLEYQGVAINMAERWISTANAITLGFMPGTPFPIHPTELGDKDIASAIGRLLRGYA